MKDTIIFTYEILLTHSEDELGDLSKERIKVLKEYIRTK